MRKREWERKSKKKFNIKIRNNIHGSHAVLTAHHEKQKQQYAESYRLNNSNNNNALTKREELSDNLYQWFWVKLKLKTATAQKAQQYKTHQKLSQNIASPSVFVHENDAPLIQLAHRASAAAAAAVIATTTTTTPAARLLSRAPKIYGKRSTTKAKI